ncbi:fatty acid--CoA ligase family protein [Ferviditalea candida]|uniref:Fatty acid--CoA ligase family protein n=1 Tax=Ferviditalea candida TaxID=3108399 RepID=A0ABU5ZJG7_9BACL|nr:fatty acid--CoA ligase family protein [Paenibacillaceae bacterium T2]
MNVVDHLAKISSENPQKAAYIFNGMSRTYEQFNGAVTSFAAHLSEMGVQKGDHVALLLGNCPEFVIGLYGALRAGATVIPINPAFTGDEIGYILNNGDVKTVIALDSLAPLVEKLLPSLPRIQHVVITDTREVSYELNNPFLKTFTSMLDDISDIPEFPNIDEEDVAVILYTSGTTGKPKGAMLTHKNIYSNAKDTANYLRMTNEDRTIATLPMFHVFCLTVALNAPLINGGTIIIVPKFSPGEIFRLVREYEATIFAGVPTMYNFLYQFPEGSPEHLASLRLCVSGGASLPLALLENFENKFNVVISEGYGLSEASPVTCFNPLDRPRKPGSIGKSILNVDNKVVNELGEELPPGEIGELIVRGPNVMKGYYNMPGNTAAAIRNGWLHTGDLAKMDEEGYFYIVDRKKDLIIVGGYNVYPREIEEVLYNHPGVIEAAVVGIPDSDYGEAVACFIVAKNQALTEAGIKSYCGAHLAKYKLPKIIHFIDELPKNSSGKILRRALREQLLEA